MAPVTALFVARDGPGHVDDVRHEIARAPVPGVDF
jgi:hypothetical protein